MTHTPAGGPSPTLCRLIVSYVGTGGAVHLYRLKPELMEEVETRPPA
jgi:hypothetical protein